MDKVIQYNSSASLDIFEEPYEEGWTSANGYYISRIWKGKEAPIKAKALEMKSLAWDYTVKQGPLWELTAKIATETNSDGTPTSGSTEIPVPKFELIPNKIEKDLLDSQCAFVSYLKPSIIKAIKDTVKEQLAPNFLTGSINAGLFTTQAEKTVAADVYLHYMNGVNTFTSYSQTLRKVYQVSNKFQVAESMYGVNMIWSTPHLIATEYVPTSITSIMLPSGLLTDRINNTFGLPLRSNITLYVGWLKGCPSYSEVGQNLFEVTVEYEYGYWSSKLYGAMLDVN
jgi:hypothetical protein